MQQALFYTILAIFITTAIVTLLGVTGRVKIQREHRKPLFASLILELGALPILLLSTINFFGVSTEGFINTLPERIRAEVERLSAIPSLKGQVVAMKNEIAQKAILIEQLKLKAARLDEVERHFLVKMARLHADIQNYGSSVNILWNPEGGKRAICRGIDGNRSL